MKRKKRKEMEEIPVGSFSDIAFLLIIFFILVASLNKTKGFETELPSGEPTSKASPDKNPSIVLTGSEIQFDDVTVTMEQTRKKLAKMQLGKIKKPEKRIVMLEAAGGVDYQQYYEMMAAISSASGVVAIVKEGDGEK